MDKAIVALAFGGVCAVAVYSGWPITALVFGFLALIAGIAVLNQ